MERKKRGIEVMLAFAVLFTMLSFVSTGCVSAATHYVPGDYAKIQWAIDNSTAEDIVFVYNGTYYENINLKDGVIVRGEGAEVTIIDGKSAGPVWLPQSSGTSFLLNDVDFIDVDTGWAVGIGDTILHTVDGGLTWLFQSSGTGDSLVAVDFVDADNGWMIGHSWECGVLCSEILYTADGGATWSVQLDGICGLMRDVVFIDADTGWAVGYNGTILHTSNGGANWSAQDSSTSAGLSAVAFVDPNNGWAAGIPLLHTSNGGATWSQQTSPTPISFLDVCFIDANVGWAVGGPTVHTTDGGDTWFLQTDITDHQLNKVAFVNANEGWAVGGGGTILHTDNGGTSWSSQSTGILDYLSAVTFIDPHNGWVVGSGGTILKYAPSSSIDDGVSGSVVTAVNVGSSTVLEGFTIRNGFTNDNGGGIFIKYASALIAENIIKNNTGFWGGGIYIRDSSPVIYNNTIESNTAIGGGGIYIAKTYYYPECAPNITHNVIQNNNASQEGGGISVHGCALVPVISKNIIRGNFGGGGGGIRVSRSFCTIFDNNISCNSAFSGGAIKLSSSNSSILSNRIIENNASHSAGGISMIGSSPTVSNNLIIDNKVAGSNPIMAVGGGMLLEYGSSPDIINNVIANNTAINGGGIYCDESSGTVTNCISWGNGGDLGSRGAGGLSITYSDIEDGDLGYGNICSDPLFVDPVAGDYRLRVGSPCIDAGNNNVAPSTDLDRNNRPIDGDGDGIAIVDMGAFEYVPVSPADHDIVVTSIDAPNFAEPNSTIFTNSTISNIGSNNESNISVDFLVDSVIKSNTTIPFLESGNSTNVSFQWATPNVTGIYNITIYAFRVVNETVLWNNQLSKNISVTTLHVFTDVASEYGVDDSHQGKATAWFDYDNDGDLDLLLTVVNCNYTILYRNDGATFVDVAEEVDLPAMRGGLSVGDYDNNGDIDILRGRLFRNDIDATNNFTEVGSYGDSFVDYDNDGDLDIYQVLFWKSNKLFRNDGGAGFVEIEDALGANDSQHSRSAVWGDYDNDGDMDLYVVNGRGERCSLYRNDVDTIGLFTDVTAEMNVGDEDRYANGACWGDYDNDGDLDLYLAKHEYGLNRLYRNDVSTLGTFTEVGESLGVADNIDGFHASWGDYDNDGDLDLYAVNGAREPSRLYRNDVSEGNGFVETGEMANVGAAMGGSWGDFDGDGDIDYYLVGSYPGYVMTNRLYQNNNSGNGNHWLHIKAIGTVSNRAAIGTTIQVVAGDLVQTRYVESASGYGSQNSLPVEFGLGDYSTVDSVIIKWPSGMVQTLTDVDVNQCLVVCESMIRGDLSGDGIITPTDAAIALQIAVSGEWNMNADVSGDGKVTSLDALMILQAAAGVSP